MLLFSFVTMALLYLIERVQHWLPFNPQKLANVTPDLAFNTAASFTTNTNWQAYTPRIDDELFDANGRARLPQFYFSRSGHSSGDRCDSRNRAAGARNDR